MNQINNVHCDKVRSTLFFPDKMKWMKLVFTSFAKEILSPRTPTRSKHSGRSLLQIVSLTHHPAEHLQIRGSSVKGAPKSRVRSLIPREKEAGAQERHSASSFGELLTVFETEPRGVTKRKRWNTRGPASPRVVIAGSPRFSQRFRPGTN